MSDADKYLARLDRITLGYFKLGGFRYNKELMKGRYKWARDKESRESLLSQANLYLKETDSVIREEEPEIRAYARALMDLGSEENDINLAFTGAKLYKKIGKGRKAIQKLLKIAERNRRQAAHMYPKIKNFIEDNANEKSGGLEGRVGVFILAAIGGIALSISSLTATGNAISNLTTTTSGLLGIIFFVVGLAGLVFNLKKK